MSSHVAFNGVLVGLCWPAIFWPGYIGKGAVPRVAPSKVDASALPVILQITIVS
jgi:hypothetical protein